MNSVIMEDFPDKTPLIKEKLTRAEIKRLTRQDFRTFSAKYLKIKDKQGNIIPFVLNKAQLIVLGIIEVLIELGLPIRLIVLKARQKGISTLVEAYIFWRTTFRKNRKAAIVGHESDATDNMWDMTNRYYDNLPEYLQPSKKYHNAKELTFAKTKSEIFFWTAEKGDVGSSHTVQDCHLTELSKWRDPKTTLTALLQTIPDYPNTLVGIESTARGFGGEFHDRWVMSKKTYPNAVSDLLKFVGKGIDQSLLREMVLAWLRDKREGSNYLPIFLPWFIDDEYSLPFDNEEEKDNLLKTLDEIEEELLKKGATAEHLKWRRKIGLPDKCGDDPDVFKQEYPSDDIECFLMSGRPVFSSKICNERYNRDIQPIKIGYLEPVYKQTPEYEKAINSNRSSYYDLVPFMSGVKFVEDRKGYIKIYEDLQVLENEYHRFAAGCDVAEGLDQGDYSVIKVLDRRNMAKSGKLTVPITWHGHADMDELAIEQHKLQTYLKGNVWFATEKNNNGHAVIISAYKLKVNQYYAQDFSKGYEAGTDIIGFRTSGSSSGGGTRPEVINVLNEWIREGYYDDLEKEFWEEALTFVYDSRGKAAAQDKIKNPGIRCYDDRIIAEALMLRCHNWMPSYYLKPPDTRPDWLKELDRERENYTVMGI